uniref:Uncharacterized protein n=1 Tax=Rhizophora mucronata TaxID=61149 RepID=A0A2P2Q4S1_RHIMU
MDTIHKIYRLSTLSILGNWSCSLKIFPCQKRYWY